MRKGLITPSLHDLSSLGKRLEKTIQKTRRLGSFTVEREQHLAQLYHSLACAQVRLNESALRQESAKRRSLCEDNLARKPASSSSKGSGNLL